MLANFPHAVSCGDSWSGNGGGGDNANLVIGTEHDGTFLLASNRPPVSQSVHSDKMPSVRIQSPPTRCLPLIEFAQVGKVADADAQIMIYLFGGLRELYIF